MKILFYLDYLLLLLLSFDVIKKMDGLWQYMNLVFIGYFLIRVLFKVVWKQKKCSSYNDLKLRDQWEHLFREMALLIGLFTAVIDLL